MEMNRLAACERFLRRLLDPEDLGHAVTAEVRDAAREALGRPRVETERPIPLPERLRRK